MFIKIYFKKGFVLLKIFKKITQMAYSKTYKKTQRLVCYI